MQALGRWQEMLATLGWQLLQTDVSGSQQLPVLGASFWASESPEQLSVGHAKGLLCLWTQRVPAG